MHVIFLEWNSTACSWESHEHDFACLLCEIDGWNLSLNEGESWIQECHLENKPFRTRKTYKFLNQHANLP